MLYCVLHGVVLELHDDREIVENNSNGPVVTEEAVEVHYAVIEVRVINSMAFVRDFIKISVVLLNEIKVTQD